MTGSIVVLIALMLGVVLLVVLLVAFGLMQSFGDHESDQEHQHKLHGPA